MCVTSILLFSWMSIFSEIHISCVSSLSSSGSLRIYPKTKEFLWKKNKTKQNIKRPWIVLLFCYCCSVIQSCPSFCDPMDCSKPGFSVLHQLQEACSNSCPLSWWCHPNISSSVVPFSPAFNLFQHQNIFQWVGSSHQVAKVLELQLQHQSFHWITQDWFSLGLTGLIFLQPKGLSRFLAVQESKGLSRVRLQHHSSKASILCCPAFFMVQFSHPYMTTGKIIALTMWTFFAK